MAGETQNYHETRNPHTQTADYSQITLSTTSKSIMSVTTDLPGSGLTFAAGYWDIGKKWHCRMFGKATTVLTPGNITVEIRHQTGATVADAGGTILATSGRLRSPPPRRTPRGSSTSRLRLAQRSAPLPVCSPRVS
jgi:hypothetical protein